MRGRFYSPAWHRFMNSNQGVDPNLINHFAYTIGSPMMMTDPTGMDTCPNTTGRSPESRARAGGDPGHSSVDQGRIAAGNAVREMRALSKQGGFPPGSVQAASSVDFTLTPLPTLAERLAQLPKQTFTIDPQLMDMCMGFCMMGGVKIVGPPTVGITGGKMLPDPAATGPHTTLKSDPVTGKITNYQTWEPQSNPRNPSPWESKMRYDSTGEPHYNKATQTDVPTPHVHDPATPGGVRNPLPGEEIP